MNIQQPSKLPPPHHTLGVCYLQLDVVEEGVQWFSGSGLLTSDYVQVMIVDRQDEGRQDEDRQDESWDYDKKLTVAKSIKQLIKDGEYQKNLRYESFTDRFISDIRSATVFLDVGGECGYYSCLADKYMPQGGTIHVFEPNPINFKVLKSLYGSKSNFRIYENAVSNKKGNVTLHSYTEKASYSMDQNPDKFMPVQREFREKGNQKLMLTTESVALDDLFQDIQIDVIKMDIEGAEVLAFEGMECILSRGHTKIFLELHYDAIRSIRSDGLEYMIYLLHKHNYGCFTCNGNEVLASEFWAASRAYLIPKGDAYE